MPVLNLQRRPTSRRPLGRRAVTARPGAGDWRTRYVAAVLTVLGTALLHEAFEPFLEKSPFLTYLPAIMLSGAYGGLGPGLVATGLGAAFAELIAKVGDLFPELLLFLGAGAAMSWGNHQFHELLRSFRASESMFRRLAADVTDYAIYMVDPEGVIISWNAGAQRIKGYTEEEVHGRHCSLFYPPEAVAARVPWNSLARAKRDGRAWDEGWRIRKDGTRFWAGVAITPIRDERGLLLGFTKVTRDMTELRKAEEAARERYLRSILDASPGLVSFIDADGRYVFTNSAYSQWFADASNPKGRLVRDVVGAEIYDKIRPHVEAALAGRRVEFDTEISYPGLGPRRVRAVYVPNLAPDGSPQGFFGFVLDVDEQARAREALERERARFVAIFHSLVDGALGLSPDGEVIIVNNALARLFEFGSRAELLHKLSDFRDLFTLSTLDGRPVPFEQWPIARIARGERIDGLELLVRRVSDGREWCISFGGQPVYVAGKIDLAIAICRDVTPLRQRATRLEKMVRLRTSELERSVQELERYSYPVAHDLRAPLRAVYRYAELLLTRRDSLSEEERERYLRSVVFGSERMDRLISDLLDYSRIGQAPAALVPIDPAASVRAALAAVAEDVRHREAEIDVRLPELPRVIGDPFLLEQALTNLLSNAVKFVPAGKKPVIRVSAARTDGGLRIEISDNGIGIEPRYRDRMFRIFERLNASQEFPGTGIGLAIVNRAVERLGGTLGFDSEPGRGSTFWLTLREAPRE
ncbi:MAG: PAS domain S-box protein [Elusimicrobia bacterium]|nr:PAS domain S-box protein [Elusimicrobiota bacterium]